MIFFFSEVSIWSFPFLLKDVPVLISCNYEWDVILIDWHRSYILQCHVEGVRCKKFRFSCFVAALEWEMIWGIRCSCKSFGTRATALPPPITLQIFLTYKEEEIWSSEYSEWHILYAGNTVWFFSLEPLLWNQICMSKRKNFIKIRFK